MANFDLTEGLAIPFGSKRVYVKEAVVDCFEQNMAASDVAELLDIPAQTMVLSVAHKVITEEGAVATVDIGDGGVTNRYGSGLDINSESTNGASVFSAANFYTEDDTIDVLFNAAAANAKIWIAALCVDFSQKHPKAS